MSDTRTSRTPGTVAGGVLVATLLLVGAALGGGCSDDAISAAGDDGGISEDAQTVDDGPPSRTDGGPEHPDGDAGDADAGDADAGDADAGDGDGPPDDDAGIPSWTPTSSCADYQAARDLWLANMKTYGKKWGDYLDPAAGHSNDERLDAVYYDGEWVFLQIGKHLGQTTPWDGYASRARQVYVDGYLVPINYGAQGFRRFVHGMYTTYVNGGPITNAQLISMRDKPSFSRVAEYNGEYAGNMQNMSRELAYAIQANIYAEKAGAPRAMENGKSRLEVMVGWMDEHFKQWQSGTYLSADSAPRFAPFMAALSAHALIEFIEWERVNGRDPNQAWPGTYAPTIEASLKKFFSWMRDEATVRSGSAVGERMYVVQSGLHALRYEDVGNGSAEVAYDLGGLLAYGYAWIGQHYAGGGSISQAQGRKLMETADELFIGNVRRAYISGRAKQFNQSYRLSFLYTALHDTSGIGLCSSP